MKKPTKPEVAYIDNDVNLFKAANAGEKICYTYYDGVIPVATFDSAAEGKRWLEEFEVFGCDPEFGYDGNPSTLVRETSYKDVGADKACDLYDLIMKDQIALIHSEVGSEIPIEIYVSPATSSKVFRHKIATLAVYKGKRTTRKPKHLEAVRAHALKQPNTFAGTVGVEVDDEVQARAQRKGMRGLAVAGDKDIQTAVGCWILNTNQYKNIVYSDPSKVGHLEWDGKKVRGWGMLFLCFQSLGADKSDNILGVPKIGDKGAYDRLKEFSDLPFQAIYDVMDRVASCYEGYYGETHTYKHCTTGEELTKTWREIMAENMSLLYMLKNGKDSAEKSVMCYLEENIDGN